MLVFVRTFREIEAVQDCNLVLRFGVFAEMDRGFVEVRKLTRPRRILIKRSFHVGSIICGRSAKKDKIISIHKMREGRRGSGDLDSFEISINLFMRKNSGKSFSVENKEKRGEMISLSNSSRGVNQTKRRAIYKFLKICTLFQNL